MANSNIVPNHLYNVGIPVTVPPMPFDPLWQRWVSSLDRQTVKAIHPHTLNFAFGPVTGWTVEPESLITLPTSTKWVPTAWLTPIKADTKIPTKPAKIPCNCPLNTILRDGCHQPNHE